MKKVLVTGGAGFLGSNLIDLIFKNDDDQNSLSTTANLNKNGMIMLEKISLILDRIQQLSFLINYYKLTNKIPSHMMMYVDDDHSKCLQAYLEIINKLKNMETFTRRVKQNLKREMPCSKSIVKRFYKK